MGNEQQLGRVRRVGRYCTLDPARASDKLPFLPMSQQYNKKIKKARRVAYKKRRKDRAKAAAAAGKAAKSSKKDKS